jgi:hypothetical protein
MAMPNLSSAVPAAASGRRAVVAAPAPAQSTDYATAEPI